MIAEVSKDFWYQLTAWKKSEKELEFALVQFRDNPNRLCCIRKKQGKVAVFTRGLNYPEKKENKPI